MADLSSTLQLVAFGLACVALLVGLRNWLNGSRSTLPLPPGPPGKWFMPGPYAPFKYLELAETYGPVFSYRQGSRQFVVICGYQAAVDIMQKHGMDLADRPRYIAAGELFSDGMRTLLVRAGDRLRKLRKALHSHLQPMTAVHYKPSQHRHAVGYLLDILNDPEHHLDHSRRYAAGVILSVTYGKTTTTYVTDPEVRDIEVHATRLGKIMRLDAHVVDRNPILKHIPFVTKTLRAWHKEELGLFSRMVDGVRQQLRENRAQPSFTTYLLEQQHLLGLSDSELAYLAGSMFGAGADTTATAITFMIMASATHPEAQVAVQAQLDKVVGKDRLPTFDDEKDLPLVSAFFLEVFRWRPVSYGGFAHRATTDIVWGSYVIPAGTAVIGNHWGIARDSDVFPDPESFRLERWLTKDGQLRDDLTSFNFGFGRRVCPGQHVAHNSLFINTALLLWAFDIREDPAAPINTMGFTDAGNVRALPFRAVFTPRVKGLRKMVESYLV